VATLSNISAIQEKKGLKTTSQTPEPIAPSTIVPSNAKVHFEIRYLIILTYLRGRQMEGFPQMPHLIAGIPILETIEDSFPTVTSTRRQSATPK
jgi:hypothetical protein